MLHSVVTDARGVDDAASAGQPDVCIEVSNVDAGVAAVAAARDLSVRARAVLLPELCANPRDLQLCASSLGEAGAASILLAVGPTLGRDDLRHMVDTATEADLPGVPMRQRLGLSVAPGDGAIPLIRYAHRELDLLHFLSCLAGVRSPRPSEVLAALGMRGEKVNMGAIFLAEHVPDAA